jgi:hypothetical protein
MKLELLRDKSRTFPSIENPLEFSEIRIWHCRYQSLSPISNFKNLVNIEIATYPDSSLDIIGRLPGIRSLKIIHLPGISDISPLSQLKSLESLELATLPSWSKLQHISTLQPLQGLANLRSLALRGIFVDDGSLQPLHSCPVLHEFHGGNFFSIQERLSLKAAQPEIEGTFFEPIVELPYTPCSRCGSLKVILSGVIKYAIQCPKCHQNRVQRHLEAWQALQLKAEC